MAAPGLEPGHLSAQDPKSCVSANSTKRPVVFSDVLLIARDDYRHLSLRCPGRRHLLWGILIGAGLERRGVVPLRGRLVGNWAVWAERSSRVGRTDENQRGLSMKGGTCLLAFAWQRRPLLFARKSSRCRIWRLSNAFGVVFGLCFSRQGSLRTRFARRFWCGAATIAVADLQPGHVKPFGSSKRTRSSSRVRLDGSSRNRGAIPPSTGRLLRPAEHQPVPRFAGW